MSENQDLTKLTCTASEFGTLGAGMLSEGHSVRFLAKGTSMHPLVRNGDILLITPIQADFVKVGEIVLCTAGTDWVLVHRVLRRRSGADGTNFFLQGDQAAAPDGWFNREQIHGYLQAIERKGRRISMTGGVARLIGILLVLSHRMGLRRTKLAGIVSDLLKRTPFFAGYLN